MKRPPGLVYNSALLSSDIPVTLCRQTDFAGRQVKWLFIEQRIAISLPLNFYPTLLVLLDPA
jgi:hypothetical protein